MKKVLHESICKNWDKLNAWYDQKRKELPFTIYTSVDIRDAGFKLANVDANIYPAGFNNICEADRESAPAIFRNFVAKRYGKDIKKILLITEEHTGNPYYWQNVHALSKIIENADYDLRITMPKEDCPEMQMPTSGGETVSISASKILKGKLQIAEDFNPDLIVSNNDFSEAHEDWAAGVSTTMTPPRELGWYQRKKTRHFKFYNQLVEDFAGIIGMDPWLMQVESHSLDSFNSNDEASKKILADKVEQVLANTQKKYQEYKVDSKASVFIKNNSGTYGLAVTQVSSGKDVLDWNNKTRTKMKAAKGGRGVSEIIIQEGIPSSIVSEDATAEPVIYMLGCEPIGGFLRAHKKKGPSESLNSPGAVYKRLCMTDLRMEPENHLLENVYGWVAKLSGLAISYEAQEMGVKFQNYQLKST